MKFVHAFALIITVLLYLVRQRCVFAGISPVKRYNINPIACSSGNASLPTLFQTLQSSAVCARTSNSYSGYRPKYKRDPDIMVDNENIGIEPVE